MSICETEEDIMRMLPSIVEEGHAVEAEPRSVPLGGYVHIRTTERPLCAVAVLRNTEKNFELVTGYPVVVDIAENELEIHSLESVEDEEDNDFERIVRAITRDGGEIAFFCPAFRFFKSLLESNIRFWFGLSAIAYSLEKAPGEFEISEGAFFEHEKKRRMEEDPNFDPTTFSSMKIFMNTLRCYFDRGNGDFEFQSVVEDVTPFEGLGASGHILLVNLMPDDRAPIRVKILASRKTLGAYIPEIGDPVRGVAWLQGVPQEALPVDEPWMDSAEAAREGGRNDGLYEGIDWMWSNPQLPLGLQVVGGAFVGAGWTIKGVEQALFRSYLPAFVIERGDRETFVFVRTAINGFCQPEEWTDELLVKREKFAAANNANCLNLTVNLAPVGDMFDVSIDGLGDLAETVRAPLNVKRPEWFEIVEIGKEKAPEPVMDVALAAATFAKGMTAGDLAEFSRMLVEDFEYDSETTNWRILGRQQYLGYLGDRLEAWNKEGRVLTVKPGSAKIDGEEQACAFSFWNDTRTPFACTVFIGRRGHIASARNIFPENLENVQIENSKS